jgi:hypothetical protein
MDGNEGMEERKEETYGVLVPFRAGNVRVDGTSID